MIELITLIRALYLLKHNCHNLVSKISFFADHEFLGSSYELTLGHYDALVERVIGLGHIPDIVSLQINAANKLKNYPLSYKDNLECFQVILEVNKSILQMIEPLCKASLSQGFLQLLGGIADDIEIENYKLGQRTKGK